jgi:hypothetical protein
MDGQYTRSRSRNSSMDLTDDELNSIDWLGSSGLSESRNNRSSLSTMSAMSPHNESFQSINTFQSISSVSSDFADNASIGNDSLKLFGNGSGSTESMSSEIHRPYGSVANARQLGSQISAAQQKVVLCGSVNTDRNSPTIASSNASVMSNSSTASAQAKCRQLPCRTFISTGSCPYNDRCVFLHDPSVVSSRVFIKVKRKSREDIISDAFFW